MEHSNQFRFSLIVLILLGTVGCSSGSNKNFAQIAEESKNDQANWSYTQTDTSQVSELTDLVDIPQLTMLINQAIEQNPSLQQTALAVRIAYADRGITNSDRIPQLSAGFSANKDEDSDAIYAGNLTVSWELDLWQKISDDVKASDMDIASYEALYQSARDILAANIMRAWLQVNLQQQLIDIETMRLVVLDNNEATIFERYRSGLGEIEELDTAHSTSASARATLAEYHEELAQNKRSLWLLVGQHNQNSLLDINNQFPNVLLPLASLPEQDLSKRPDLQSAYYDIVAEQFRTNVAYKELLPSISIEAALTDIASSPSDALLTSPAWSLLGQLTAPLFQGGKLRKNIEISELKTEQTYWAFQDTLLSAVNEVENYLGQEQSLNIQHDHIDDALNSAKQSFANYQIKYRQGLIDILDLLTVQQYTFDLQTQLTMVNYNRLINRINLGLALGLGVSS